MFRRGRRIFIGRRAGAKYHIIIIISSVVRVLLSYQAALAAVRVRPRVLPGIRQTISRIDPSLPRALGGRSAPRVNRRQLHIARFPPGARRSDARCRANVALLPCRIPRNLCHVEEAILSLVAADDRNGAKMSAKGEAEERVRQ